MWKRYAVESMGTLIARFMGPTCGPPPGADRTQVGPMLTTWTLLSVILFRTSWHRDMEISSPLLALCEWKPTIFGGFPSQSSSLVFSLLLAWTNCWTNARDAGDLARYNCNITVPPYCWSSVQCFSLQLVASDCGIGWRPQTVSTQWSRRRESPYRQCSARGRTVPQWHWHWLKTRSRLHMH